MRAAATEKRPTVIVDSFSFHAFATVGYFYCWELGARYNVVLIVPEEHAEAPTVKALVAHGRVGELVVIPGLPRSRRWHLHRWLAHGFPALVQRVTPVTLFVSNVHYFNQKYMARAIRNYAPNVPIFCYLNVRISPAEFAATDRQLVNIRVNSWRKRWPWLPAPLVKPLHDTWGRWVGFRDYSLYPVLLTGRPLRQTHCPWRGQLFSKNVGHLFDAYLCYDAIEEQALRMECPAESRMVFVAHPMRTCPDAVEALFGAEAEGDSIAVLPSTCFIYDEHTSTDHLIEEVGSLWVRALRIIQERSGGGTVFWKLHPSYANDPVMAGITQKIQREVPGFVPMPVGMSAEKLIKKSKITVGDFSTTLLWARRLGTKPIFSLNVFGVDGGDEMKFYPGIRIINSIDELEALPSEAFLIPEASDNYASGTVLDFLQAELE